MKRIYFQTEEIKTVKKKGYVEIDDSYTQVYDCLFKIAFKMKSIVETQLLFYFCSKATEQGVFYTDDKSYKEFVKHAELNGGASISKVTYFSAIKNLLDNKVIVKIAKGQYQLNPFLLWKASSSERLEHIEEIMLIPNNKEKEKYTLNKTLIE